MLKQVLCKCYNKMRLYQEEESNLELGILEVNYNSISKLNFEGKKWVQIFSLDKHQNCHFKNEIIYVSLCYKL